MYKAGYIIYYYNYAAVAQWQAIIIDLHKIVLLWWQHIPKENYACVNFMFFIEI